MYYIGFMPDASLILNTGLIRHDRLIRGFVIDGVHKRA